MSEATAALITHWMVAVTILALLHLHVAETEEWRWRSFGWTLLVGALCLNLWTGLASYYAWPVLRFSVYVWLFLGLYLIGSCSVVVAIAQRLGKHRHEWHVGVKRIAKLWLILAVVWLGVRAWYGRDRIVDGVERFGGWLRWVAERVWPS